MSYVHVAANTGDAVHASDDTIVDLGERLYQTGLSMAPLALTIAAGEPVGTGGYRPPLSSKEQQLAVEKFPEWKRRYST